MKKLVKEYIMMY